jgi:hypothetical protein
MKRKRIMTIRSRCCLDQPHSIKHKILLKNARKTITPKKTLLKLILLDLKKEKDLMK